ncbi:2,3-diaminopropionate biosynthesis protein SbnB [Ralstonia pseudosolanacearum]|uniref:2,3-diaminopropionate biosynthesis protein SbnB n=1 Tax=Ralstonia pseudosolanacearum TaxID=1310165 RepID=UPI000316DDAA|nr:2,3-diaminopropionate biosynthesis protein SbnB [Ralstonia pseudosolanacearum]ARS58167.1 2,3-diaminopropionate biosynthesis protein SbnB [Ralstonia solanacearum FJAT-91]ESS50764.1 ornithine cyclodeaminase protein [Ralstonia solanacearum SD54]QKZ29990.1 2,3-diaminopropionate biosynthesis protein SbnB [Ralstonia solanacearum]MCK4147701.1 2,3-diaminopropionate biosynthesis protein SbnB [Ralstonia pseudosolanacearum]QKZ35147.1 2,3-diaminopropionate biosynthesis protein SbnB [Ralstonia solanacea
MTHPADTTGLLYLGRQDLVALGGDRSQPYVDAITEGLALHAKDDFVQPLKPYLRWPGADHIADRIIAMPCYVGGEKPIAGLKWIGSRQHNPSRFRLERASAVIVLNDADTNYPVAIMEGGLISGMRTAAISAVATRHLAREGFTDVACIGCGPIARMQMQTLIEQFPGIRRIHLFDVSREAMRAFGEALTARFPQVACEAADSAEQAVRAADVIVTCTVTDSPYLEYDWLRRGAFVCNVSIMDVHKEVYEKADKVVVDDWDQSNREKKVINQLVLEGRFSRERLHAELGEIVIGERPGRENDDEIILLNPMGMAIDDMVCARHFYQLAARAGVGTRLPLL